jgi:D-arabinose 1-dehydrogenase-like Zn-dependent alcohol dehydrogenase
MNGDANCRHITSAEADLDIQMKALIFSSKDGLRLEEREAPKEQDSEAIVKVKLAGICSTVIFFCLGLLHWSSQRLSDYPGITPE